LITDLFAEEVRRQKEIAYYFRYPLHARDFFEIRREGRLEGYYSCKPLYGKLTPEGRVDRSAGYNGQVAVIFIELPPRSVKSAKLLLTAIEPSMITNEGKKNWKVIREAAEIRIREYLAEV
jgi:hypothetical protein